MTAYYNEIDPYAAQWLRNLIAAGHIAPGEVDERSIRDVAPKDVAGFDQAHFFAGIGVWSHALRLAGWPDDQPVWTGSCPCQPFSAAGKQLGTDDERHLWPEFARLIRECRPPIVLGEQVASALGRQWLDAVRADLEALGYAVAAADLGAASVGAPHIRQRLWWVADARSAGLEGRDAREVGRQRAPAERGGGAVGMADAQAGGRREQRDAVEPGQSRHADGGGDASGGLADAECRTSERYGYQVARASRSLQSEARQQRVRPDARDDDATSRPSPLHGFWRDADWLLCRDGKWRPVEPGTFPLAHGASARVGRLRAYGNAIVAPLAAEFIAAVMDCRP